MQTKARALFQQALSSFFSTKQCMTMHDNNRSLYRKRQNRVEAVVRSGRGDETKRDEKDDLHCGVFSHSAMKDTGKESSGPLPAAEQSHPHATTTPPIQTHQESIVEAVALHIHPHSFECLLNAQMQSQHLLISETSYIYITLTFKCPHVFSPPSLRRHLIFSF